MLSSVADLHSYIERNQLTQDLGGSQYYCHKTWISHRTVRTNALLEVVLYIFYTDSVDTASCEFKLFINSLVEVHNLRSAMINLFHN